jgi:hypothetical protein
VIIAKVQPSRSLRPNQSVARRGSTTHPSPWLVPEKDHLLAAPCPRRDPTQAPHLWKLAPELGVHTLQPQSLAELREAQLTLGALAYGTRNGRIRLLGSLRSCPRQHQPLPREVTVAVSLAPTMGSKHLPHLATVAQAPRYHLLFPSTQPQKPTDLSLILPAKWSKNSTHLLPWRLLPPSVAPGTLPCSTDLRDPACLARCPTTAPFWER